VIDKKLWRSSGGAEKIAGGALATTFLSWSVELERNFAS